MSELSDIIRDVSPESLASANEADLAEGLAACALAFGGEVRDEPICSGARSVSLLQVEPCYAHSGRAGDVRRAYRVGNSTGAGVGCAFPLGHRSLGSTSGNRRPAPAPWLYRRGRRSYEMGINLAQLPGALHLPEGVTVERVEDRTSLEQWVRTSFTGFELPASGVEAFLAAVSRDDFGDAAAAHYYLARLAGEPVATAALSLAGGVAGIFAVGQPSKPRAERALGPPSRSRRSWTRGIAATVSASCRPQKGYASARRNRHSQTIPAAVGVHRRWVGLDYRLFSGCGGICSRSQSETCAGCIVCSTVCSRLLVR